MSLQDQGGFQHPSRRIGRRVRRHVTSIEYDGEDLLITVDGIAVRNERRAFDIAIAKLNLAAKAKLATS